MSRKITWPLLLAGALLFCVSCRRPTILFVLDPYSLEVWGGRDSGEPALRELARNSGLQSRFLLLPRQGFQAEALDKAISGLGPDLVYLSPFLPFEAQPLVERHRPVSFLREYRALPDPAPANLVQIRYQRALAYEQAGRETASFLRSLPGRGAGILISVPTPQEEMEVSAFQEGFHGQDPGLGLEVRRIESGADRVRARHWLDEMRAAGAAVILLKTYALTGFCLENMQKEGGWAVVEDLDPARSFSDVVLLSLREDPLAAIEAAMALKASPAAGPRVVEVPLRLQWNEKLAGKERGRS